MKTKKDLFKPVAGLCLSNYGGVEIMLNRACDAVLYSWYGKVCQRWQEIKYNFNGDPYFTVYGRRFYLNEFMRYDR